jgi:hypothetical protein
MNGLFRVGRAQTEFVWNSAFTRGYKRAVIGGMECFFTIQNVHSSARCRHNPCSLHLTKTTTMHRYPLLHSVRAPGSSNFNDDVTY